MATVEPCRPCKGKKHVTARERAEQRRIEKERQQAAEQIAQEGK